MKLSSPIISLAFRLSRTYGEMKDVITISPASFINFATSAIRRIFSIRSASLNPRFLFSPIRTLSPSKSIVCFPRAARCFSNSFASVDLPEPESPVSQIVLGVCPFCCARKSLVISISCHVRLSVRLNACMITPQADVIFVILSMRIMEPNAWLSLNFSKTILSETAISQAAISFL